MRSLFLLKDKNDYKSSAICKGDCSCGETKHNTEVRWNKHKIQLRIQHHRNTLATISNIVLRGLSFQIL